MTLHHHLLSKKNKYNATPLQNKMMMNKGQINVLTTNAVSIQKKYLDDDFSFGFPKLDDLFS